MNRYTTAIWQERDRLNISLEDNALDTCVFSLWDDDARGAVDDGFITLNKGKAVFLSSCIEYATMMGLIKKGQGL